MPNFFDFHFHPMFKQFLCNYEADYPSKRPQINLMQDIRMNNDILNYIDEKALHILGSQCSFNQIKASTEMLSIASIVSLEHAIADGHNLVGDILRSRISAPLDKRYFDLIINAQTSYYHLFIKELNLYAILANIGYYYNSTSKGMINILTRKNPALDLDNLSLPTFAFSIEGGHNLNRNLITKDPGLPENLDKPVPGNFDEMYSDFSTNSGTILSPGKSLEHLFKAMWAEDMDLLYLTLTHLTYIAELPLATHAFGMKLLMNDNFYPSGLGLTPQGKEVIDSAYGMTADGRKTPVLIDVKHMSLKSRLDFYKYRKEKGYTLPILATHMGVTGYTIPEWINRTNRLSDAHNRPVKIETTVRTVAMENSTDLAATNYHFNTWSINLMDEDIINILESDGMIGISLDRRILGIKNTTKGSGSQFDVPDSDKFDLDNPEYLSPEEYHYFFVDKASDEPGLYDASATIPEIPIYPDSDLEVDPDRDLNSMQRDQLRELVNFALHILHIVAVGNTKTTKDPWSHIVLGSDYDGLIDPLIYSENCTQLKDLEDNLLPIIISAESSYRHYNRKYNKPILPGTKDTIDTKNLKEKIRDIMYNNGKNFLKKWYSGAIA